MPRTYPDLRFDDYATGGAAELACWEMDPAELFVPRDLAPPADPPEPLDALCRAHLGSPIARLETPGGERRQSVRLHLQDGRRLIATHRGLPNAAAVEAHLLQALGAAGAPVPAVRYFDGRVLLQADVGGRRLTEALADADEAAAERLLDAALDALHACHHAAGEAGLDGDDTLLPIRPDWIVALLDRPAVIGHALGIAPRQPDLAGLFELFAWARRRLVKWDARPGNAAVDADGRVYWFDWEDACFRNWLDDMVWLLCDELLPERPAVEQRLIERHLPRFADDLPPAAAHEYLACAGVFHLCVRLGLVLAEKGDGPWRDPARCLDEDQVGVHPRYVERLCRRGARWAARSRYTVPLADWFERVGEALALPA